MDMYDREEQDLGEQLESGFISLDEYNKAMRDLQRAYRDEAMQSAEDAYRDELDRW